MGADFMYTLCPACAMTPEQLARLFVALQDVSYRELIDMAADGGQEPQQIIRTTATAIINLQDFDNRRDVSTIRSPYSCDGESWISGGMSWGDRPTEACDIMEDAQAIDAVASLLVQLAEEEEAAMQEAVRQRKAAREVDQKDKPVEGG